MTPTQNPTAYLKAILTAFGPDHAVQFNQETWSQVHSALRAALAETAEPVAGWKLVPVEPTIAMLMAGRARRLSIEHDTEAAAVWNAMLNAAPQPPAPAVETATEKFIEDATRYLKNNSWFRQNDCFDIRKQALEEAAQIAEREPRVWDQNAPDPQRRIAAAIRAAIAAHEKKRGGA